MEEEWLDTKTAFEFSIRNLQKQAECGKLFRDANGMIYFHCCHCQEEFEYIAEFAMHLADDHPMPMKTCSSNYPDIKTVPATVVIKPETNPADETEPAIIISTEIPNSTETSLPPDVYNTETKAVPFSSTLYTKRKWLIPEWSENKRRKREIMKCCPMCKERFSESDLQIHLAKLGPPIEEVQCPKPNCNITFKALCKLQKHLLHIHSDKFKKHRCHLCDKKYKSPGALVTHLRTHEGIKPFECNDCGMRCSSKAFLRIHFRRAHSGKKPFQCWYCGESFSDNCYLKYHIQVKHTTDKGKTLQCDKCEKTFVAAHRLKIHYRSHTGERPYPCKLCEKAFTCVELLNVHMTNKHINARSFKCTQCPRAFNIKGKLKIHERTVHKPKVVKLDQLDIEYYD